MADLDWKPQFIAQLKRQRSPKAVARALDLPWSTVTSARQRDIRFRRAWDAAVAGDELAADPETPAIIIVIPGDGQQSEFFSELQRLLRKAGIAEPMSTE